jgi:hypothetical protein
VGHDAAFFLNQCPEGQGTGALPAVPYLFQELARRGYDATLRQKTARDDFVRAITAALAKGVALNYRCAPN